MFSFAIIILNIFAYVKWLAKNIKQIYLDYLDNHKQICYTIEKAIHTTRSSCYGYWRKNRFFPQYAGYDTKVFRYAGGLPGEVCRCLAQYETGTRTPKADLTAALADTLDVSPQALAVPDIDSYIGLLHTLFTLEDRYGLEICESDDEVHLRVNVRKNKDAAQLHEMLCAWR